jgi:TATA-box binding protein (TBP) (component of TFIID and TFIIIB)
MVNHLKDHIQKNVSINENEKKKCIQKFKHLLNSELLPADLTIATMTVVCKFDTKFNCINIGKYISLHENKIQAVYYGDITDKTTNRVLVQCKKKKKKRKKTFYNQTTVRIKSKHDDKTLNVKVFKNGAIQMTGCKTIIGCIEVLHTLCKEIRKVKGIINPDTSLDIVLKPFASDLHNVSLDNVYDLRICMINSGFDIGFNIDREALYLLLCEQGIECKCDLDNHACVNIKYNYKDRKKVPIFVFAKGKIIITGANNCNHILEAYEFISMILLNNYQRVKNIEIVNNNDIRQFLSDKPVPTGEITLSDTIDTIDMV